MVFSTALIPLIHIFCSVLLHLWKFLIKGRNFKDYEGLKKKLKALARQKISQFSCSAFLTNCWSLNTALLLQPSFSFFLASVVEKITIKLRIVMQIIMFITSRWIAFTHHKKNMIVVYILDRHQGLDIIKPYGSGGVVCLFVVLFDVFLLLVLVVSHAKNSSLQKEALSVSQTASHPSSSCKHCDKLAEWTQ